MLDPGRGDLQLAQDLLGVFQKNDPLGRQGDGTGGAVKQFGVQFFLQGVNLAGNCRLCHIQQCSGMGKIQVFRHLNKAFQLLGVQSRPPWIIAFYASIIPFFHFFFKLNHGLILYIWSNSGGIGRKALPPAACRGLSQQKLVQPAERTKEKP